MKWSYVYCPKGSKLILQWLSFMIIYKSYVYYLIYLSFFLILPAFQKLGLDCANWTEPVYSDLVRWELSEDCTLLCVIIKTSAFWICYESTGFLHHYGGLNGSWLGFIKWHKISSLSLVFLVKNHDWHYEFPYLILLKSILWLLSRRSAGNEERMLILYFNRVSSCG